MKLRHFLARIHRVTGLATAALTEAFALLTEPRPRWTNPT
jgi:hypothetical protein